MTPLFPVFLKLEGRPVLVVGGGPVAASKVDGLLRAGARVKLVAPQIREELEREGIELVRRGFEPGDLDGCFFVVAAAPAEVNARVLAEAERRGLFVNAVDDVRSATAYLGGVVRRGGVTVAVSTEGRAPALAGLLREALERVLPDDLDEWVALAERLRAEWKREGLAMAARRPRLLQALVEKYSAGEVR